MLNTRGSFLSCFRLFLFGRLPSGVTPLMFLMQAIKPVDDEGGEAMANVLAVINKVSGQPAGVVLGSGCRCRLSLPFSQPFSSFFFFLMHLFFITRLFFLLLRCAFSRAPCLCCVNSPQSWVAFHRDGDANGPLTEKK